MNAFFSKTFGGLSKEYYLRHLFFSTIISSLIIYSSITHHNNMTNNIIMIIVNIILALLYPYSRFVYESVVNFIIGDNSFILPIFVVLITKLFTMVICYACSIFIAPIGLIFLYFYYSYQEKKEQKQLEIEKNKV